MKKGKILALALAAGITFMGAGYAAWTDTVQINTTVESGHLDVDFGTEYSIQGSDCLSTTGEYGIKLSADTEGGENGNNNDIATITIGNAYPGATATILLPLVEGLDTDGQSSIAAQLNSINILEASETWGSSKIKIDVIKGSAKTNVYDGVFTEENNPIIDGIAVGDDCEIKITITFGDNVLENTTSTFKVKAYFGQFYGNIPVATDAVVE